MIVTVIADEHFGGGGRMLARGCRIEGQSKCLELTWLHAAWCELPIVVLEWFVPVSSVAKWRACLLHTHPANPHGQGIGNSKSEFDVKLFLITA